MKRLLACTLLLTLFAATASAQPDQTANPQHRSGGGDRMVRMQKNLGLTDEQVKQMREIRERGGSREEMRAVLTEEQRVTMQERRRQAQERKQSGRNDPGRYYTQPGNEQPADPDGG
jgi:Spy/CpxP family protein refolding chaperone